MMIKKACIYFVITSMHEAISLLVNVRTSHLHSRRKYGAGG